MNLFDHLLAIPLVSLSKLRSDWVHLTLARRPVTIMKLSSIDMRKAAVNSSSAFHYYRRKRRSLFPKSPYVPSTSRLSISDLEWALVGAISSRVVSGCELAADYFQSTMTCKPPILHGESSNLEEVVSGEEAYGAA